MNNMRQYINLVESPVDEGKLTDILLSKLPGGIGQKAKGRQEKRLGAKEIGKRWSKYQGTQDVKKNDPNAFREFLVTHLGFTADESNEIIGSGLFSLKQSLETASKILLKSTTVKKDPIQKGRKSGRAIGRNTTDFDDDQAIKLAREVDRNPKAYSDQPLALVGWAYLKTMGQI